MHRKGRTVLIMLCAGFLLPTLGRSRGWDIELRKSLPTSKGLLRIDEVGQGGFRVSVDGKLIRELEGFDLAVWGTLPTADSPQYILLALDTGNGFCPYKYVLLDVTASPAPYLTHEFADCSPVPKVSMNGPEVKMDFPSSQNVKTQVWVYDPVRHDLIQSR